MMLGPTRLQSKKSSASSPHDKQRAEKHDIGRDIRRGRWTRAELKAARRIATRRPTGDDSDINYDDIPRVTEEQLANVVRLHTSDPRRQLACGLIRVSWTDVGCR